MLDNRKRKRVRDEFRSHPFLFKHKLNQHSYLIVPELPLVPAPVLLPVPVLEPVPLAPGAPVAPAPVLAPLS